MRPCPGDTPPATSRRDSRAGRLHAVSTRDRPGAVVKSRRDPRRPDAMMPLISSAPEMAPTAIVGDARVLAESGRRTASGTSFLQTGVWCGHDFSRGAVDHVGPGFFQPPADEHGFLDRCAGGRLNRSLRGAPTAEGVRARPLLSREALQRRSAPGSRACHRIHRAADW